MKEKLLVLCYRAPYPLRSGSEIRMYQFIEILSDYYEIDLLYLKESEEGDMSGLEQRCGRIEKFTVKKTVRLAHSAISYCFRGEPLQAGYFYSTAMQRWLREHICDYPNILCMHIRTVGYLFHLNQELLAGKKLYFDGIDAISLNYENACRAASGLKRLVYRLEYLRMRKYEKKAYEWFDCSILISERDRDYIRQELGADCNPAVVCNYAIDFGYLPEIKKKECTIAFMGKMNYAPNVDAVLHFVKNIFWKLKQRFPALEFEIIGGFATKEIQRLDKLDGIRVCGFVDDPAVLLQEATVIIAPMISGSGLQNKIVQAMYLGCTVVTTKIGAEGLNGVTEKELIISETDEDMLKKLTCYLQPQKSHERQLIGERARKYIAGHYSYEAIRAQMKAVFDIEN